VIFLQRLWQALSGLITIFLLIHFLTPIQQGWYYSFLSLAALYTLLDLGLSVVLVQFSAHLFINMKWLDKGQVAGEGREQFLSLTGQSLRLYLFLGLMFCFLMIPAGMIFFEGKDSEALLKGNWQMSWIFLVIVTAINILVLPFLALVEGSGRIFEVYGLRLLQGVLGSMACWAVLSVGGALWAASMIPLVGFLVGFTWLFVHRPNLLFDAWSIGGKHIQWSHEVWPLQWRIGLSWLSGYFLTQIYTPILFYYQNAEVAGQMGLSLTIANMLGLLAHSWIAVKIPDMGKMVAIKDWEKFDTVFKCVFFRSLLVYLGGAILLTLLLVTLNRISDFGERVLPITSFIGLLFIIFGNHINGAFAAHLRSYKKEPLVLISIISTLITIPIALYGAWKYSALGVVVSILLVQIVFTLPVTFYFWLRLNREWRLN
jgi:hypothetical protein